MKRKIYNDLVKWKDDGMVKPLMVIGARQVGKTYIVDEFCRNEFKNYIYFNLFYDTDIVNIFEKDIPMEDKIVLLKLAIKKKKSIDVEFENTILFIDEIQESENLISALKYFAESKQKYNIIAAGSLLGVKLKRMKAAFPVGKVDMLYMNSLDFEEFIYATIGEEVIPKLKTSYEENTPIVDVLHNMLLDLYRAYLCVGGMPEAVNDYLNNNKDLSLFKRENLENIKNGYLGDMRKYVTDANETIRIENIYNSIALQLGNKSNKFQYSKVNKTARAVNYETAMQWLISSKMVDKICSCNIPKMPLEAYKDDDVFKLYLNDVGLLTDSLKLNFFDILEDVDFLQKGILAENFVMQQLVANRINVYYWKDSNYAEIDFLIYNNDGVIPIEVKAGDNVKSSSLNKFMKQYTPQYAIRVSTKNFGFANGIKSVPLYAAFLIR